MERSSDLQLKRPLSSGIDARTPRKIILLVVTALTVFAALLLCLSIYYPQLSLHQFDHLEHSKTLPYCSEKIQGREQEIHELLQRLDFSKSDVRVVNIIGSPGIGKSALAIHVGHRLTEKNVNVHYVNMAENSDRKLQLALAERVLGSANDHLQAYINFNQLVKWAQDTHSYHLLILDGCDDSCLLYQKDSFQEAVNKIIKSSNKVKVLITSREATMDLEYFRQYKLYELSTRAACALLRDKLRQQVSNISEQEIETLAELAGNVPLTLQIVGSLLQLPDPPTPSAIIEELKAQLFSESSFSPEQLRIPTGQYINTSLNVSYEHLATELRIVGQFWANFPGSFGRQAAAHVFTTALSHSDLARQIDIYTSMESLLQTSLLIHNKYTDHFNFNGRLIREYFREDQRNHEELQSAIFWERFDHYYTSLLSKVTQLFKSDRTEAVRILDTEKHNFQKLFGNINIRYHTSFESVGLLQAVAEATSTGLLKCSFADEYIATVLRNSLNALHTYLQISNQRQQTYSKFEMLSLSPMYFSLITQLASLEESLHGSNEAIETFLTHEATFNESLNYLEPSDRSELYTQFYSALASYHFALDQWKEGLECHRKIISFDGSKEHEVICLPGECTSFFDIGMAYHSLGKPHKALYFLERSWHEEELPLKDKVYVYLLILQLYM